MLLEKILDHINNYFVVKMVEGDFTISSGEIDVDFLQDGQYFKIFGSVFNDGVHEYPAVDLTDETFSGVIWAMAVPPSVIALYAEIEDWCDKYGDVASGPYVSESFGGYSYSKGALSGQSGSSSDADAWKSVFKSRLNRWRKI